MMIRNLRVHYVVRSFARALPLARRNHRQRHRYGRSGHDGHAVRDGLPGFGLTYLLGKPRIKVSHFAMVNLIAGEEIVPELVQQNFTAEKVVARLNEVLPFGPARDKMIEGFAMVKARLRGDSMGPGHPAERAARSGFWNFAAERCPCRMPRAYWRR